jgi:nitrogen regulatory protein PII
MDLGLVPTILVKVCVKSEDVERATGTIVEAAKTGEMGDRKIFIYPVSGVIRIRTGETKEQAL